jgi:hypothetical protein
MNLTLAPSSLLFSALVGLSSGQLSYAISFTTVDHPMAGSGFNQGTTINGIDAGNFVGTYTDALGNTHGYIYDGSFATLDDPLATPGTTHPMGISGSNIVGFYSEPTGNTRGFLYDGHLFSTIAFPQGGDTWAFGISGNRIVGAFGNGPDSQGFIFDGASFTILGGEDSGGIRATGVSGKNIVGTSEGSPGTSVVGFLYDGSTYTTLTVPMANRGTYPTAIDGKNIVGYYTPNPLAGNHGFLFDGAAYVTLDAPSGIGTFAQGISGNKIAGFYYDSALVTHGFIATIPEPSSLALLSIGLIGLGHALRWIGQRRAA